MKLVHPNIDVQMDFEQNKNQLLIIENAKEFYNLVNDIVLQYSGKSGSWVLSKLFPIDIKSNAIVLHNFFDFSCNNKKVENLLKTEILQILNTEDFLNNLSTLNKDLISLCEKISPFINLPLTFKDNFSFEDFYKILNFSIQEDEDLISKVTNYVDIFSKLTNASLVVLINATTVLEKEQILQLVKDLNYKDLSLLLIESKDTTIPSFKKIIIDNDLCVI